MKESSRLQRPRLSSLGRQETGEGDRRQEKDGRRQGRETGDRRRTAEDREGRQETGEGRQETGKGDRRQEKDGRRQGRETGDRQDRGRGERRVESCVYSIYIFVISLAGSWWGGGGRG